MKNTLIITANNEISQSYHQLLSYAKFDNINFNKLNLTAENIDSDLNEILKTNQKIDIIINCILINSFNKNNINIYLKNLAEYCKQNQIFLINYSCFQSHNNHDENSQIVEAENIIKNHAGDFLILRIFDIYNTNLEYENFYTKIVELSKENQELSYSDSLILYPTSADFVVNNTIRILSKLSVDNEKYQQNKNKIYRLSNNFITSEYEFAELILKFLKRSKEIIKLNKIISTSSIETSDNTIFYNEFSNYLIDENLNKFNNKYLAVFAHFDKDNIIDDYVIFYLQQLKLIASSIIFVSDCDLDEKETLKIANICDKIIVKKHHEYPLFVLSDLPNVNIELLIVLAMSTETNLNTILKNISKTGEPFFKRMSTQTLFKHFF